MFNLKNFPFLYIIVKNKNNFKKSFKDIIAYRKIKKANLFDEKFYLEKYPDVKNFSVNFLLHYIFYGYKKGKNPSNLFDTNFYLLNYNDVKVEGINPLVHYCLYGVNEKRHTNPKKEIKEKNNIIQRNFLSLTFPNFTNSPLVSIIILNRNGITNLKRLFKDFKKNTIYPNYEIIVVDNGSTDKSIEFLKNVSKELSLRIIKNKKNKTFSEGNNQGVREANGEYVLLLNNDIETTYGWLNEMMGVIIKNDNVGSVGAKLVYPRYYDKVNKKYSFKIQHAGIAFKTERDNFRPYNLGKGKYSFNKSIKTEIVSGVTAAALLIKKSVYKEVNGLDEEYIYGFEDVDLGLKLFKNGYDNILCSTALLFHHESSTQKKDSKEEVSERRKNNFRILNKRWKPFLFEKIFEDKFHCEKLFTKEILKIGIIVSELEPNSKEKDVCVAFKVSKELINMGYFVKIINKDDKFIDPNLDIIINFLHNYDINDLNLRENTINIAWMIDSFEKWINKPDRYDYDIYIAPNKKSCEYANKFLNKKILNYEFYEHGDLKLIDIFRKGIKEKLELFKKISISIKIPAPNIKDAKHWGDYHFALSLKKEFKKKGYSSKIITLKKWYANDFSDIVLVLRGLNTYKTNPNQINIMWNISHPELVDVEEYNDYDYVFISSNLYAKEINRKTEVPVLPLLQCTDTDLFFPEKSDEYKHELLFVGNSRRVYRQIIKDLLPIDKELGLYGRLWEDFVPRKYITDDHIPNIDLHKAYSSCKILLNDHWEDMAKNGFVSNRIFDGFASGAFIISDKFEGSEELFGEALVTYSGRKQLHNLIDYYIENEEERKAKAKLGHEIVLNNHTFEKRAEIILDLINNNI